MLAAAAVVDRVRAAIGCSVVAVGFPATFGTGATLGGSATLGDASSLFIS
jgi:hypothetical protein